MCTGKKKKSQCFLEKTLTRNNCRSIPYYNRISIRAISWQEVNRQVPINGKGVKYPGA